MKMVISPAKSLDFERPVPFTQYTTYDFAKESATIDKVLKKLKRQELQSLMDISPALATLNWERNQERDVNAMTVANARQAIFAFDGEVYTGLDAYTLTEEKLQRAQEQLRILSGLYGLLKPLDMMQPYRLEMGTKLPVGSAKDLYAFWKSKLTKTLNASMEEGELLLNLASTEYFSALDAKQLKAHIITPEFKDYKDGKLKMISFFAKKARGLMVRYVLDTQAQTVEALQGFHYEGYAYDPSLSTDKKLVFTR
ncbi:peroxide stress protein YaaA [Flavobacterium sp.]|uniref:peroxide stress protein YaaA n=1 Tax=Flavobacterium sp. TaxID=239 RepID=UPI002618437C|nr:peroxide stress protein YaaA [Flavobacterium sp.]